jgi:tRNA G18 (ribose-2'-O)-methylase SpoU
MQGYGWLGPGVLLQLPLLWVQVLQMLDATVEIPQLGLIRSLNVHVAGAIALFQYTCFQRQRKQLK